MWPQRFQFPVFLSTAIFSMLVACGSGVTTTDDSGGGHDTSSRLALSDAEILAAVYDNTYSAPNGFFVDERADTPRSYSLYHVKDVSNSYELCSDEFDTARSWEASDNTDRAVSGLYVGAYENDNYFEFIRELSFSDDVGNVTGITSPGFARVFKCSRINRNGVDRNLRNGYGGMLDPASLSPTVIREFAEYLWQFTFFADARSVVLDSIPAEDVNAFRHTLLLALAINQGFDRCDRIEVTDWTFSVDKSSGSVTREFRPLYTFEAQLIDGVAQQCLSN